MNQALKPDEYSIGALATLVREIFGARCTLRSFRIIKQDAGYLVAAAELANPTLQVVIKLAGPQAPLGSPFDRTAAILALVNEQTTVPTAKVLAVDTSYEKWPWRYIVTTLVGGKEWAALYPHMKGQELEDACV